MVMVRQNILRWVIVGVTVLTFACGFTLILGLLDPYSAYGRIAVNVFKPVYMSGNNLLESVFHDLKIILLSDRCLYSEYDLFYDSIGHSCDYRNSGTETWAHMV